MTERDLSLSALQARAGEWSRRNFGDQPAHYPLLGVIEELGELAHAELKGLQSIRYTAEEVHAKKVDAAADVVIYLIDFVNRSGYDLARTIRIYRRGLDAYEPTQAVFAAAAAVGRLAVAQDLHAIGQEIADVWVALERYAVLNGFDLLEAAIRTFDAIVAKRDWRADPVGAAG